MNVTDEIKSRLDILDVVGRYITLKRAGRNYKALCPFHGEKTPSFVVFPDSQNWRCFGCGRGGDIFNFVMEQEGLEFREALQVLAELAGVDLAPPTPQQVEASEQAGRLRTLLSESASFFNRTLLEAPHAQHARDYVARRGLDDKTVMQFRVGYAPNSWDATTHYLTGLGFSIAELVEAGMVVEKDAGGTYDRFRDRLMIAIRDGRGDVVGFGARALAKDANPKYINSPQSPLFDKSSLLFGFSDARRSIRETETAVIVEGYMDVMQAHQAGFTNVVAQMGTALTEAQLQLLARYASRLILALDPDSAGQMATDRGREVIKRVSDAASEEVSQEGVWGMDTAEGAYRAKLTTEFDAHGMVRYKSRLGFDLRVVTLPEGMDPDDLIRQAPDEWISLLEGALPVVEYAIQRSAAGRDLNDPQIKNEIADAIIPMINDLANPVERSHYRQRLARLLKVDERTFFPARTAAQRSAKQARPQRSSRTEPAQSRAEAHGAPVSPHTPTASREAFCLAALLRYPRLIYEINRLLAEALDANALGLNGAWEGTALPAPGLTGQVISGDFSHPEYRFIFETWLAALDQDEMDPLAYLYTTLDPALAATVDDWLRRPLESVGRGILPATAGKPENKIQDEALRILIQLRMKRLQEYGQELEYLMSDSDQGGDYLTASQFGVTITALRRANLRLARLKAPVSPDAG